MAPSLNKSPQYSRRRGHQAEPTSDERPSGDAPLARRATPIEVKIDRPVRAIADIQLVHGVPLVMSGLGHFIMSARSDNHGDWNKIIALCERIAKPSGTCEHSFA